MASHQRDKTPTLPSHDAFPLSEAWLISCLPQHLVTLIKYLYQVVNGIYSTLWMSFICRYIGTHAHSYERDCGRTSWGCMFGLPFHPELADCVEHRCSNRICAIDMITRGTFIYIIITARPVVPERGLQRWTEKPASQTERWDDFTGMGGGIILLVLRCKVWNEA